MWGDEEIRATLSQQTRDYLQGMAKHMLEWHLTTLPPLASFRQEAGQEMLDGGQYHVLAVRELLSGFFNHGRPFRVFAQAYQEATGQEPSPDIQQNFMDALASHIAARMTTLIPGENAKADAQRREMEEDLLHFPRRMRDVSRREPRRAEALRDGLSHPGRSSVVALRTKEKPIRSIDNNEMLRSKLVDAFREAYGKLCDDDESILPEDPRVSQVLAAAGAEVIKSHAFNYVVKSAPSRQCTPHDHAPLSFVTCGMHVLNDIISWQPGQPLRTAYEEAYMETMGSPPSHLHIYQLVRCIDHTMEREMHNRLNPDASEADKVALARYRDLRRHMMQDIGRAEAAARQHHGR